MSITRLPLGTFLGARSGDKGGNANVGVWVRDPVEDAASAAARVFHAKTTDGSDGTTDWQEPSFDVTAAAVALADARYAWLRDMLTVPRLQTLLPETAMLKVERFELANLRGLNFVITGLLGRGVAETTRLDPQAKGLGEHLRARLVDIPGDLLGGTR